METEKMTAEERLAIFWADEGKDFDTLLILFRQACSEARLEGIKQHFKECDEREAKKYQEGRREGAAEMREKGIEERKFWINPLEVDPLVKEAYRNGAAEAYKASALKAHALMIDDPRNEGLIVMNEWANLRALPLESKP
jgi:hypothetical protein